jgi:ketosteroid isomerase-like protein
MSSANLDLVRSIYAAWADGDFFSSADWADPEIEYVQADGPAPRSWKGLAGLAEAGRDWLGAWEDYRTEAQEYRELDDERVLVLMRRSGRGKTSRLELGQMRTEGAGLFSIRDSKVVRLVVYNDPDRALADLSLGPEGTSQ